MLNVFVFVFYLSDYESTPSLLDFVKHKGPLLSVYAPLSYIVYVRSLPFNLVWAILFFMFLSVWFLGLVFECSSIKVMEGDGATIWLRLGAQLLRFREAAPINETKARDHFSHSHHDADGLNYSSTFRYCYYAMYTTV